MSQSPPSVSVVIPVRDGAATIEDAVRSALDQDYVGPLEVVVADAMSEDGTRSILDRLRRHEDVIVVDNPQRTTPAGLNAAISASGGDVIVRCDAHSELPTGYVTAAVEVLAETGAAVVGGVQEAEGSGLLQRAVAHAMATPLGAGGATYRGARDPGPTDTVYLGVFQREALEASGLYDESLVRNQDYELNYRLRLAGHQVWFTPRLRVRYRPRARLGALWRQYFDYGRWKRTMLRRNIGALRARQLAAPALVIGLALSLVAAFSPWPVLALVIPGSYAVALAVSAVAVAVRHSAPAAGAMTLVVLPTMHVGWGTGFLIGRVEADEPRIPGLESH